MKVLDKILVTIVSIKYDIVVLKAMAGYDEGRDPRQNPFVPIPKYSTEVSVYNVVAYKIYIYMLNDSFKLKKHLYCNTLHDTTFWMMTIYSDILHWSDITSTFDRYWSGPY